MSLHKRSKIYLNLALCLLFIVLGCGLFGVESSKMVFDDIPLYPLVGLMTVIVHFFLLIKWLYILATTKNHNSDIP